MTKKEPIKSLQLRYFHIKFIADWMSMPLVGRLARQRSRFLSILAPKQDELEKNRLALNVKFAEKEPDGKPIKIMLNDIKTGRPLENYKIADGKLAEFNKELTDIFDEEFSIDILPSNREVLVEAKKILEGATKEMDIQEGAVYDQVMSCFDKVL